MRTAFMRRGLREFGNLRKDRKVKRSLENSAKGRRQKNRVGEGKRKVRKEERKRQTGV